MVARSEKASKPQKSVTTFSVSAGALSFCIGRSTPWMAALSQKIASVRAKICRKSLLIYIAFGEQIAATSFSLA